jgi:hypothetical protein
VIRKLAPILAVLILSIFCIGQNGFSQGLAACSPVGTWYGGSDVKYLLTITPITGDTFAVRAEVVLALGNVGIPAWTSWSGQFRKVNPNLYVGHYMSMYTGSTEVPPSSNSYEMDAVRGWMKFTDCQNISISYDYYGVYFDLGKVPFVDAPDVPVDVNGLVESYHRMPTNCTDCDPPDKYFKHQRPKH